MVSSSEAHYSQHQLPNKGRAKRWSAGVQDGPCDAVIKLHSWFRLAKVAKVLGSG